MKIVFATGNSGKLREASEILGGGFELVPLHRWASPTMSRRQASR